MTRRSQLHTRLAAVVALFLALTVVPVFNQSAPQAPSPTPPTDDVIAKEVDALVRSWGDLGWFTGSVVVAHGDRVLYRGAAGMANPEFNAPNTPETLFRLVTITQLFTAAAVLRLQEQGKLDVHDPIGKYMIAWPDAYKPITIEQLLVGTSGVKDVTQIPEFVKSIAVPRSPKDLVATILREPLAGAPGTVSRPVNSNYHLLTAIIEQVSGQPYVDFIRTEVIARAGLTKTLHDSPAEIVAGRADGLNRSGPVFTHANWFHMDNTLGMADLMGTADDVFRFVRALTAGTIISASSLAAMTTDHSPPSPAPPPAPGTPAAPSFAPPGNGYGWALPTTTPRQWSNTGFINGFSTSLTYLPDSEITVVVLSNVTNASESGVITRAILYNVLTGKPVYHPVRRVAVAPRAEDLAAVAGIWDIAGAIIVTPTGRSSLQLIARVDGPHLFVKLTGGVEVEWKSDGPGRFFSPNSDQQVVLTADKPGQGGYVSFGGRSAITRVK